MKSAGSTLNELQREAKQAYLLKIQECVELANELAGRKELSPAALTKRAEVWTKHLYEIIPIADLEDSFVRAFEDDQKGYAINATDIVKAFRNIDAERKPSAQAPVYYDARLMPSWKPCDTCLGSGWAITSRTINGRSEKGAVKSFCCDYWERRTANR